MEFFTMSWMVLFGLVLLTSRFKAILGLFWDGTCNFESWSGDQDDT